MIKLIKSSFYKEDLTKKALNKFIEESSILSMNKECLKYEKAFAQKQQRKFAVFVNSGSSANLILIQSLLNLNLLKKGDKVAFSTLTWATNVMPLMQLGLIPVALDCELETLNVSSKILQKKIKNIKALFLTNVLGFCGDIDKIKQLCASNKVLLLEDNCESLGSKIKGKLLGNFGLASTFSFFVGHHLSTIEGGMVCTDDKNLYDMLAMARAHGWDRSVSVEKQNYLRKKNKVNNFFSKYTFYDLAYNVRPTEITGVLGNQQIKYWDEIVDKRAKNFKKLQKFINANPDFEHMKLDHMELISNFAIPVVCKTKKLFEKYKSKFQKADVEIRPIIAGDISRQPFFKKYLSDRTIYKNAKIIHENGFYFGNSPEYTDQEISTLANLLKK
jgi:CDP-6-deoxy-D-xylo-4-hexulose-3-dehydrase